MKLSVSGVAFAFPSHVVLDGVTFEVEEGTLLGILGPNGAGKSTLLRLIHAALEASRGSVLLDGEDLARMPRRQLARRVGVVPQSCTPGFSVDVREFVRMGRYAHESFLGGGGARDDLAVEQALADVGLGALAGRDVQELSGGEFRRVLIAQALAQEAPLLLLDEPVQQLDLRHQLEVMELVRRVALRPGRGAVAVLHDLALASRYCDAIVLLVDGRVAAAGAAADVITPALLRKVYGVEALVDRCPDSGTVRVTPLRAVLDDSHSNPGGRHEVGHEARNGHLAVGLGVADPHAHRRGSGVPLLRRIGGAGAGA